MQSNKPSSLTPDIIIDQNRQRVSLALKLALIIENEDRRVGGFIKRLGTDDVGS